MMIVLVFDPLAVLLLIAANWQMKQEQGEEETPVFVAVADEPPSPKEIVEEQPKVIEVEDDLLFEGEVQPEPEPKKDWEPELYQRKEVKEMGRYESELAEQEKKRKLDSFLAKAGEIEQEVETLNKK
jgi:hypothetical protein